MLIVYVVKKKIAMKWFHNFKNILPNKNDDKNSLTYCDIISVATSDACPDEWQYNAQILSNVLI